MTELEKLIDRVGQIAFRLETNFESYRRHFGSFQHPENATRAREALLLDFENLKAAKHEMVDYAAQHPLAVDESQRQMTLLALAHLSVRRPGWNSALSELALKLDTPDEKGRPKLYEQFKDLHVYALPDDPAEDTLSRALGLNK